MQLQIHNIGVVNLNGKGCLTGCGLHGYSLASVIFLIGQSNIAVFLNKTFLLL